MSVKFEIGYGRAAISNPPHRAVVGARQHSLLLVNLRHHSAEEIFAGAVIEQAAISADGAWAVTTGVPRDWDYFKHDWNGPRIVRLFDLQRKTCVRTWETHQAVITDLALSRDGRYLATASKDCTAQLWDLRSGELLWSRRSGLQVDGVAITPSGHRIAYVSRGGVLAVRRNDGTLVGRNSGYGGETGCVAISKDGQRVVAASSDGLSVVDLKAGRKKSLAGTQTDLMSVAISSDARSAITGELGRQLVLWDLTKTSKTRRKRGWISGMWATADRALIMEKDGVFEWDLASGRRGKRVLAPGHFEIAIAPGRKCWAVARWSDSGGRVMVGKLGSVKWQHRLESPEFRQAMLGSVQLSRDAERVLVAIRDTGCRVYDLKDSRIVWQQDEMGLGARPFLSQSGRFVVLGAWGGQAAVVDINAREVVQRKLLQPIVGNFRFLANEESIMIDQGTEILEWNWQRDSSRAICPGSLSSVSEDGNWLVSVQNSRKLTLWDLAPERRIATYTLDIPVERTALSADGRFLVAGDSDGEVHILERVNG